MRQRKEKRGKRGGYTRREFIKTSVTGAAGLLVGSSFGPSILTGGFASAQQSYPNRPISMVVWSTAGMGDTVTRTICKGAEKILGQPIVIDTRPGAAGAIAINYALKTEPDGYTLCMTVTSNYIVSPHIRDLKYDVLNDVADILTVCKYNFALCVRPDSPWNTYGDVIKFAKENPGKFTYACAGVGTTQHICMERIARKEGIKWTQVPYKSGGESVVACLGGHTYAVVQGSVDVLPHLRAGKLRMLLSLDGDKWPDAPDIPTIFEKGYDFSAMSYIAYMTRTGVPEAIMQKLEHAFTKAMDDPSFKEVMGKYHVQATYMSGKEYQKLWKANYDEMGKIVKALGLK